MTTTVVWVEIPVKNLERAQRFYETVFQISESEIVEEGERRTVTFFGGSAEGAAGFSLNEIDGFEPSDKGTFIYLDAGHDLSGHLSRVEPAGGEIVAAKTSMGAMGFFASFLDTERNLIGLYSPN